MHPSASSALFVGAPSRAPSPNSPAVPQVAAHPLHPAQHAYSTSASSTAAWPPSHSQPGRITLLPVTSSTQRSASPSPFAPASSSLPSGASASVSSASSVDFSSSADTTRPLRARIEQLERENAELKRSVLEMGVHYNRALIEVKERWKAAVRAGSVGEGVGAALTAMDGVGVIRLGNSSSAAAQAAASGEGKVSEPGKRVVGERHERHGHRSASPALFAERSKLAHGICVDVNVSVSEEDEDGELHIERVLSSGSSSSSHSHHHPHSHSYHQRHAGAFSASTPPSRLFSKRIDLLGHCGAVYALSFSGDGRLVASAGMDKTIRVWDMHAILSSSSSASSLPATASSTSRYQLLSLSAHSLNISSLAFASTASSHATSSSSPANPSPLSSSQLISASFDKTVAFHDLSTGATIRSVDVGAFATSLAPSSLSGGQLCYVGTTGKRLLTLDRRAGSIVASWDNDTMVSAVSVYRDASEGGAGEEEVLSGDHGGLIRTWSSRMQRRIHSQANDPHCKPISHLHCLRAPYSPTRRAGYEAVEDGPDDGEQRTLVATNSFDDVLRVYDGGRERGTGKEGGLDAASVDGTTADFQLLYELKGVKNQNWPIKSSFYRGKEWHDRQQWMELNELLSASPSSSSGSSSSSSSSPPSSPSSPSSPHSPSHSGSSDDERLDRGSSAPSAAAALGRVVDVTSQYRPRQRPPSSAAAAVPFSLPHSRLLASGSADGCVHVFDVTASRRERSGVGDASGGGAECESRLLQRLEGHRDRVYTCVFHPVEPVLVSAGADTTVKVWTAGKT